MELSYNLEFLPSNQPVSKNLTILLKFYNFTTSENIFLNFIFLEFTFQKNFKLSNK